MPDPFNDATDYQTGLPTLRTSRLLMRSLRAQDDEAIVELFSDERALESWFRPPYTSVEQARAYRESLQQGFERRTLLIWGLFVPRNEGDDGPLTGVGILTRWSTIHRRVDLGYYLASAHWGHGYATEAARALLAFAFETLGVHRAEAEVVPGNDSSVRVLERVGFQYEALLKERLWGDDSPQDSMLFRLFKREFAETPTSLG